MSERKDIVELIQQEAMRVYPQEACGVVVRGFKRAEVIPCKNVAADPLTTFLIDPIEYARLSSQHEIVAIFHSHPDNHSLPSGADLAGVEATALEWIIVGLRRDGMNFVFDQPAFVKPTGFVAPYEGRAYVPTLYDCYALARDFYRREFAIDMYAYPHSEYWWNEDKNLFVENFEKEGFIALAGINEPQYGDLFLIQSCSNVPNHIAVYVGDDKILHHCHHRMSRTDTYGGSFWQKHTTHHLRHISKCSPT